MSGVFFPTPSLRNMACVLVDALLVLSGLLLALWMRFNESIGPIAGYEGVSPKIAAILLVTLLCLYYNDLYADIAPRDRIDLVRRLASSFITAGFLLVLLYYAFPYFTLGRGLFLIHFPLAMAALLVWRGALPRPPPRFWSCAT